MTKQQAFEDLLEDLHAVRTLLSTKLLSGELNVSATGTIGELYVKVCQCETEAIKGANPPRVKPAS